MIEIPVLNYDTKYRGHGGRAHTCTRKTGHLALGLGTGSRYGRLPSLPYMSVQLVYCDRGDRGSRLA